MKLVRRIMILLVGATALAAEQPRPCPVLVTSLNYPPMARVARIEATVDLKVRIEPDGRVSSVDILTVQSNAKPKQVDVWFSREASENVREWVFEPAASDDSSVRELTIQYIFKLAGEPAYEPYTRIKMHLPSVVEVISRPPA